MAFAPRNLIRNFLLFIAFVCISAAAAAAEGESCAIKGKMSKSKGNGVAPGEMAEKYGVDTLRMAMMFGAPTESDLNFDEKSLVSMKLYLDKVQRLSEKVLLDKNQSEIPEDSKVI